MRLNELAQCIRGDLLDRLIERHEVHNEAAILFQVIRTQVMRHGREPAAVNGEQVRL